MPGGGVVTDPATGLAFDSAGNVFVAGDTYGSLDGQRNAGEDYLFVSKLDSSEYRLKT